MPGRGASVVSVSAGLWLRHVAGGLLNRSREAARSVLSLARFCSADRPDFVITSHLQGAAERLRNRSSARAAIKRPD
jgi:hypothetical protein